MRNKRVLIIFAGLSLTALSLTTTVWAGDCASRTATCELTWSDSFLMSVESAKLSLPLKLEQRPESLGGDRCAADARLDGLVSEVTGSLFLSQPVKAVAPRGQLILNVQDYVGVNTMGIFEAHPKAPGLSAWRGASIALPESLNKRINGKPVLQVSLSCQVR